MANDKSFKHTPAGLVAQALWAGAEDFEDIRTRCYPNLSSFTDMDVLAVVKIVMESSVASPPTGALLIWEEHVRREHKNGDKPVHNHGVLGGNEHDHEVDIAQYREEVIQMAKEKGSTKTATKAEKAERKPKVVKTLRDCVCDCGGQTKGNFVPGHDARVYSMLRKEAAGEKVKLPAGFLANAPLMAAMRAKLH